MEERGAAGGVPEKRITIKQILLIIAAVIVLYFLMDRYLGLKDAVAKFNDVFMPILLGAAFAFLMNPVMMIAEKYLLQAFVKKDCPAEKEKKLRGIIRTVATTISALVLVAVVAGFLLLVVPQFVEALKYLADHVNEKIIGVIDWADNLTGHRFAPSMERAKSDERIQGFLTTVIGMGQNYLRENFGIGTENGLAGVSVSAIVGLGGRVVRIIVNILVAIFVAIYVLVCKERYKGYTKRLLYAMVPVERANATMDVLRKANDIFYGFIIGKVIDSAIIGVICYVSMLVMQMPYPLLCSFIVGVTNVIPIFGPYIGAVPTVILIFVTDPPKGIIFLIYVIILQQIDGNLIGPKILGDSTGVTSFWVIFAIVVGGRLFGLIGMLVGVPVLALILYILDNTAVKRTTQKNLPTEAIAYEQLHHVDLESGRAVTKEEQAEITGVKNPHSFAELRRQKKRYDQSGSK